MPPRFVPFPLACARAKFSPVYVEDVALAFVQSIDDPRTYGKHYQLCGPTVYTLKELVLYTATLSGIRKPIVPLGNGLSKILAIVMGMVPGKPFSIDNYRSTKIDSICDSNSLPETFAITPRSLESVVPQYIGQQSQRARYNHYRRMARRNQR